MPDALALLSFACLFGASLSALAGWRKLAYGLGSGAVVGGGLSGLLQAAALPALLAAIALLWAHARQPVWRPWTAPLIVALALAATLHLLPGFERLVWREDFGRTGNGLLRWQLDKGFAGLLLLLAFHSTRPVLGDWARQLAVLAACVLSLPLLGWALGLATPDPRWLPGAAQWLLGNLFLAVLAEEAFFRLCVQHPLQQTLGTRHAPWLALLLSAGLFAAVHAPWGAGFACLAGVAGLAYGWLGRRPEFLAWSVACHALTNAAILLWMHSAYG